MQISKSRSHCGCGHSPHQRCTNQRRQVALETQFCSVAPKICVSSVWNLLLVTLLAPSLLRLLLDFWNIFVTQVYNQNR
jgi:hypothetical protein